jgi:hypothetical protein
MNPTIACASNGTNSTNGEVETPILRLRQVKTFPARADDFQVAHFSRPFIFQNKRENENDEGLMKISENGCERQ